MSEQAEALVELAVDALLSTDAGQGGRGDRGRQARSTRWSSRSKRPALELLALQQPMARDLRFIVSAIKVSSDLERVGDHAVNIAQTAQRLVAQRVDDHARPGDRGHGAPRARDARRRARRLPARRRRARPRRLPRDDQVDALHDSVFRILLTHMMADPRTITPSLELLLVSRNLERVADLATNIGEDAVFLAEGKTSSTVAEWLRLGDDCGELVNR